ncbi:MAG: glycosyl hydrolase family 79 C-terminal domain-containing protein [Solirubrobacteraceae bacterium]
MAGAVGRAATGLAVAAVASTVLIAASPATAATTIPVTVGHIPASRPLPRGFLGLALEYRGIPGVVGSRRAAGVNPALVGLIRALNPEGGTVIRVGGESADRSWWPIRGVRAPLGNTYTLTPAWVRSMSALAQAVNARLILGLGLEADRPRLVAVESRRLLAGLGKRVMAFTIGNEDLLYSQIPWYRVLNGKRIPWFAKVGTPVYARPLTYSPAQYEQEWSRTEAVLPPGVPLAGPDLSTILWLDSFEQRLMPHSRVRYITIHEYPLSQCDRAPTSPAYPSVPHLLAPGAATNPLLGFAPSIALAHHYGARFLVDEMGSDSCTGTRGVSNTLASALWLIGALFQDEVSGVDGVQLHTYPGLTNDLFDFKDHPRGWRAVVRPLYYGALMFTQADPPGSRLLRATSGDATALRTWATIAPDHQLRVLLIDDSLHSAVKAVVRIAGARGPASLERLRAPSAYSTGGVTLGGQSFGPWTTTGVLPAPMPLTVAGHGGAYTVALTPGSAALLTLPPA